MGSDRRKVGLDSLDSKCRLDGSSRSTSPHPLVKIARDEAIGSNTTILNALWTHWDEQIEADAADGRLDHLVQEVEADIAAGRVKPLDAIIDHAWILARALPIEKRLFRPPKLVRHAPVGLRSVMARQKSSLTRS